MLVFPPERDWIRDRNLALIQANIQHDVWLPISLIHRSAVLLPYMKPLATETHAALDTIKHACWQIIHQSLRNDLIALGYVLATHWQYEPPTYFEDEQLIPSLGQWAYPLSFEQVLAHVAASIDTQIQRSCSSVDELTTTYRHSLSDEQYTTCTRMRVHSQTAQAVSQALILDAFASWLHQHQIATRNVGETLRADG
jgi:hypothetical protein